MYVEMYSITNLENAKKYVGSAKNSKHRFNSHRHKLRKGEHHSSHLQNAWKKYGEDKFAVAVLEVLRDCTREERMMCERWWMDVFRSTDPRFGYNQLYPIKGEGPSEQMSGFHRSYWYEIDGKKREDRVAHLTNPELRDNNSRVLKHLWENDEEFRTKRIAGLDRGREKTNKAIAADPEKLAKRNAILAAGRAKCIAKMKSKEGRANQSLNALLQQGHLSEKEKDKLLANREANQKTKKKRGHLNSQRLGKEKRSGNDIV